AAIWIGRQRRTTVGQALEWLPRVGVGQWRGARDSECVVIEIARQIRCCGNQSVEGNPLPLIAPLVVNEEERLIFAQGSAERPTILVEVEFLARGGEKAAGVERSIAEEFEQ